MPVPFLQQKRLPEVTGIAATAIATADIPPTGTFYNHRFRFLTAAGAELTQAQLEAECTNLRIRVNGDLFVDAPPSVLNVIQGYYNDTKQDGATPGSSIVDGILQIDWVRSNLLLPDERRQYAIGSRGVTQMTAEFQLAAIPNLSRIEVYALQTSEQRPVGTHLRILRHPQSFAQTGEQELSDLPRTPNTAYLAVHVDESGGQINDATVTVDGNDVVDEIPDSVQTSTLQYFKRTPQAGYFHLAFDLMDQILNFLPMNRGENQFVQDLRFKFDWDAVAGAPGNYDIYSERIFDLQADNGLSA